MPENSIAIRKIWVEIYSYPAVKQGIWMSIVMCSFWETGETGETLDLSGDIWELAVAGGAIPE